MSTKTHVGIIGMGVVGSAVRAANKNCAFSTYDKYKPELTKHMEVFEWADLVFVCVPTPTEATGYQDLGPVVDAMNFLQNKAYTGVVVLKSTVLPGTCDMLQHSFPKLRLVHNPEFLSERTAVKDYLDQKIAFISGKPDDLKVVTEYFEAALTIPDIVWCSSFQETELMKYVHNNALPVMLSFLNEVFDAVPDKKVFAKAVNMAARMGNLPKHFQVAPDGKRGWGGMCFVKDTVSFLRHAQAHGSPMTTLKGAIEANRRLRPEAYDGREKTGLKPEPK